MLDVKSLLSLVEEKLPKKRFMHSLSVASTAEILVFKYSLEPNSGYVTGLFHDYYRYLSDEDALAGCGKITFPVFPEELENPVLLHAPIAAWNMRRIVGEDVPESYVDAVRFHTLGSKDMGKLGAVLFVADYAEPLRTHLDGKMRIDILSSSTLEETVLKVLRMQDEYFLSIGRKNAEVTVELEAFLESGGEFS